MEIFFSPDNIDQETYSHIIYAFALKEFFINKSERFRKEGSEGGREGQEWNIVLESV